MANIDNGFRVEILSFDDQVLATTGADQPNQGAGFEAPVGSLYLRQNGELWVKTDTQDIDWQKIQSFPGGGSSLNEASTGLIYGGAISVNGGDATQFDIATGAGIIVDHHTDPLYPTYLVVAWNDIIGTSATFIGTTDASSVVIDSAGSVVQFNSPSVSNETHKNYIYIGQLSHILPATSLLVARSRPDPVEGPAERLADLSRALGPINIEGNLFLANGANLQMNKTAGRTHSVGVNFHNNQEDPDVFQDPASNPVTFFYSWRDGLGGFTSPGPATNIIDPNSWDDGSGILQTVPNGRWTIQIIHFFTQVNVVRVEYGQRLFSTRESALDLLPDPDHVSNPTYREGVVRCYLVISANSTDLSDISQAEFVEGAKFGSGAGGQFSSSVTDLQQAYLNSITPEITTEATRGALTLKEGVGVGGNLIEGLDDTDTPVFNIDATGQLTTGNVTYPNTDGTIGQVLVTDGSGNINFTTVSGATDEFVKVSGNDTTAGYIETKIVAGSTGSIVLNTLNDGANETFEIETSVDLGVLNNEVDAIELGSGGIFASDGTYNGDTLNLTATNINASTNLAEALLELDAAITGSSTTKNQFYHHNGAVTQTFSAATTMLFGTTVRADAASFTYSNGVVTINETGWYRITYDLSFDATTNQQLISQAYITVNGVPLAGSNAYGYHRAATTGMQTITGTVAANLTATDTVSVVALVAAGPQNITSLADACRLNIRAL